jgi:hypothetical protein
MGVERCPGFHVAIDNELMLLASFDLSELDVLLLLLSDSFPFFQFITRLLLLLRSWRRKKKERNKKEEKFVSFFFLSKVVTKQKDFFSFRSFLLCNFFILFF